jgi:hypothetical protein
MMIHDIPVPEISPAFTVDDIHKIREWNYERLKEAKTEERLAEMNSGARETRRAIEEIRKASALIAG